MKLILYQALINTMLNTPVFNQVTPKRGYLCLCLLLLAMVFSSVASIQMTLSMLPDTSAEPSMSMANMDDGAHQHCDMDGANSCHGSDASHDHKGCSQAHCSTLPVLSGVFELTTFTLKVAAQSYPVPTLLAGQPETPYIPPIA
ncbi:hypothetical protein [Marinomonas ostreistagni]|uniref:hypothetical protein n=1 Tax=Marinomonas ostreistagni TaxID=359209 RepID=UPI0019515CC4|nr:hypothetical protein [Marinomonas ostreistagni]MBM6550352.1 hypothetical protein [Marinomonas ostreistagni]